MNKVLITIHTDSDFWLAYDNENIDQHNETVWMVFDTEQQFIDAVYQGRITTSDKYQELLLEMVNNGEGCYGNYSYSCEPFVGFIHHYCATKDILRKSL